jgi:hypothetical protein
MSKLLRELIFAPVGDNGYTFAKAIAGLLETAAEEADYDEVLNITGNCAEVLKQLQELANAPEEPQPDTNAKEVLHAVIAHINSDTRHDYADAEAIIARAMKPNAELLAACQYLYMVYLMGNAIPQRRQNEIIALCGGEEVMQAYSTALGRDDTPTPEPLPSPFDAPRLDVDAFESRESRKEWTP